LLIATDQDGYLMEWSYFRLPDYPYIMFKNSSRMFTVFVHL